MIRQGVLTSGATASRVGVDEGDRGHGSRLLVSQVGGIGSVHLGGADVTTGTGLPLRADATVEVMLDPGDALYVIGTGAVRWMQTGV